MKKQVVKTIAALLLAVVMTALGSGCGHRRDYGMEFNLATDCQYSYVTDHDYWKNIQSDGKGQYLMQENFIYYYNTAKKTLVPLCSKPNCLHDKETDNDKRAECNAFCDKFNMELSYLQYYDGYVYYVLSNFMRSALPTKSCTLYRVKKDGSKKDAVFTTSNEEEVFHWLIHRGVFYYEVPGKQQNGTDVYDVSTIKAVALSSHMSDKNGKVIFATAPKYAATNFSQLLAYRNYLCFEVTLVEHHDETEESPHIDCKQYLYNIETETMEEIPVPEGYSKTTLINRVTFLKDKLILQLFDTAHNDDKTYPLPLYSINYDLTDEKVWLDNVPQYMWLQSCGDYVILSDGNLHYDNIITEEGLLNEVLKDAEQPCINVTIYSSDAREVSAFVYPRNESWGKFNGFGPDGIYVEIVNGDDGWSIYNFSLDDVLNCHGEKIKIDLAATRSYEALQEYED